MPKTVTRQRRGCDLNPGPSAPESSTLTTRLPSARCELQASLPMSDCQLQHNAIPPAHRPTLAPPCGPHPSARIVSTQGTIEVYETSHDQWTVDWSWIGSRVTHCVVLYEARPSSSSVLCAASHTGLYRLTAADISSKKTWKIRQKHQITKSYLLSTDFVINRFFNDIIKNK